MKRDGQDRGRRLDTPVRVRPARSRAGRGFTLVELLVVVALVAGLSAFLLGGLRDNQAAALPSAQATLANVLVAARTRALASGCRVRVLIHADPAAPARFRRMIALQQESAYRSDIWPETASVVLLPAGVAVLPYQPRVTAGFYENPGAWTKRAGASGAPLHSSSLSGDAVSVAVQSVVSETWDVLQFTPEGTMTVNRGPGDLVLATVRARAPGSYAVGESPIRAESPDRVRGVSLSTYGVPALINGRGGF